MPLPVSKDGGLTPQTLGSIAIFLAILVGIFLPWVGGMSLLGIIVAGLSASGSLGALGAMLNFSAMSTLITAIFIVLALMTVGSLGFGVRTIVTSLGGSKPKGMTPCGLMIFVIAAALFAVALVLGGFGAVQIGLWLCLAAGLASLLWGIFA